MRTVLIVDDAKLWRDRLKELVAEVGYKALEASGCEAALEIVNQTPPDLILLDYRLPGADGLETAQRIRATAGCEAVPIIIVSGEELPGNCKGTTVPHVNGFLDKKGLREKLLPCMEYHLATT